MVLVNVDVHDAQNAKTPDILPGVGVTDTTWVTSVPQPLLYVIVDTPPATPVTTPLAFTVAVAVLLLVQVPPGVVLLSDVVADWQRVAVPEIEAGPGETVAVATVLPQPKV